MDGLPRLPVVLEPERAAQTVQQGYRSLGFLLDDLEDAALLVDPLCIDGRIIGASAGFHKMTGYSREEVLGSNCRLMLDGVPEVAISRSTRKNIRDYCHVSRIVGLKDISEAHALQPNRRSDGSIFMNLFMLGICIIGSRPFILSISVVMAEGLGGRLRQAEADKALEAARDRFKVVRQHIRTSAASSGGDVAGGPTAPPPNLTAEPSAADYCPEVPGCVPDFGFFSERLQDHCVLTNGGYTAMRREPEELSTNCMVFGNRPLTRTEEGLSFRVRVERVTSTFTGLPVLGFTQRKPVDEQGLYPCVSRCLASSVLIGACGEAFARDPPTHYKMGFKKPPQEEVQTWTWQPHLPPAQREPPVRAKVGDILKCVYTPSGSIELFANGVAALGFETGRPLEQGVDYYAVLDVCLSVYSVTLLPPEEIRTSPRGADGPMQHVERMVSSESSQVFGCSSPRFSRITTGSIDTLVREALVKKGIKDAAALCNFCVTIADPRAQDCPLIAVSEEFERMTGFTRSEALGLNCRFLNEGCDVEPTDLMNLRVSSQTGAPFTAVLKNRKKSGEFFLNLLDLRGLTVAKNAKSGEDLWFLVGIQADVTDLAQDEMPEGHLQSMQCVADCIRTTVSRELSQFACAGAAEIKVVSSKEQDSYMLLQEPEWRLAEGRLPSSAPIEPHRGVAAPAAGPPSRGLCVASNDGQSQPPKIDAVQAGAFGDGRKATAVGRAAEQRPPQVSSLALVALGAACFASGAICLMVAQRRRAPLA